MLPRAVVVGRALGLRRVYQLLSRYAPVRPLVGPSFHRGGSIPTAGLVWINVVPTVILPLRSWPGAPLYCALAAVGGACFRTGRPFLAALATRVATPMPARLGIVPLAALVAPLFS